MDRFNYTVDGFEYEEVLSAYSRVFEENQTLKKEIESINADKQVLIKSRQELSNRITALEHEKQVLEKSLELTCDNLTDYFDCDTCPVHQVKEEDEYCMVIMSCEKILAQYYKNKAKEELEIEVE